MRGCYADLLPSRDARRENGGMYRLAQVLVVLQALAVTEGCRASRPDASTQQALYVAEAGLEVGVRHLREVCADAQRAGGLLEALGHGEVPVPGFERPTSTAMGIPISGSLMIRLRAIPGSSDSVLVHSTGESGGITQVRHMRVTCARGGSPSPPAQSVTPPTPAASYVPPARP